jgi:L-lactate dehydrogenase
MTQAKVGIVGAGNVGAACTFAMALRGSAGEIVLVNRTPERSRGVVADLQYAVALGPKVLVRAGDYADLAGAAVVAITAGVNERKGGATDRNDRQGRLKLLEANAKAYREIVPRVAAAAPDAVLLVVTDPPDPLADIARELAPRHSIVGTGTFLDSLRLRFHLGRKLGLDARSIDANVLGEHGTSQVFVWSGARANGVPILPKLVPAGAAAGSFRREIEEAVRFANIDIIEGTGASQLGIGVVTARLAEAIVRDECIVLPAGSFQPRFGVTLSLPSVIGRGGVARVLDPELNDEEARALQASAEAIRHSLSQL